MARNGSSSLFAELAGANATERIIILQRRLALEPRCAPARYLAGCLAFDRNKPALATRHMMICHHIDPSFESAALLAFCGLSWSGRASVPMLRVLLDAWAEFRRPDFDRTPLERALLATFSTDEQFPVDLTPLGRRLLRLPIDTLRRQLRAAIAAGDDAYAGVLWSVPGKLASPAAGAVGSGA